MEREKTTELSKGDVRNAWLDLTTKYELDDGATMIELKTEFVNLKLNSSTSPDEWINQLEYLCLKLQKSKSKMSDLDFMLHIVSNLPSCYDTIVDMCQKDLRQDTLTIKSLSQDLMSKFKQMNKDENYTALAAS